MSIYFDAQIVPIWLVGTPSLIALSFRPTLTIIFNPSCIFWHYKVFLAYLLSFLSQSWNQCFFFQWFLVSDQLLPNKLLQSLKAQSNNKNVSSFSFCGSEIQESLAVISDLGFSWSFLGVYWTCSNLRCEEWHYTECTFLYNFGYLNCFLI